MKEDKINKLISKSIKLYQDGDYVKAEKICQKILDEKPENYHALLNMGNIQFQCQRYIQARYFYQILDSLFPNNQLIKINLANANLMCEDYAVAEVQARQALNLDSSKEEAQNILGISLLEQEKYDEAAVVFEHIEKQNKKDAWLYNYLSQCYQEQGKTKEALQAGWQAILLSPQDKSHHINFGYMLYELSLDSIDENIKKYASLWLQKYPENNMAKHMGKAILNQSVPDKANAEYVKEIFDIFADNFDKVLADLDYQTPQIISRFLQEIYGLDSHIKLHILDAGCGTGLCGKFLKPYARFFGLHGVDLSEGMLREAKKKKLYDHLFCNDIVAHMQQKENKYDLIVSADVLTYFGSLDSLFEAAKKSLKKGGRFIFSITANEDNDSEYILHQSGRYKHHKNYIFLLLKKYGFDKEKEEYCCLRKEALQEVKGYIISAKKP